MPPRNRFCVAIVSTCLLLLTQCETLSADDASLADQLVAATGVQRGVCATVATGPGDTLPIELAESSEWLVHVRSSDPESVDALRRAGVTAGLGIRRLSVEQGGFGQLPYADNILDVLVIPDASGADVPELDEMLRAVRPQGTILIGGGPAAEQFRRRTITISGEGNDFSEVGNTGWLKLTTPALAGAGDWSHWEHGPDNNPVSEDELIQFPYMTQFLAEPYYIAMPSITTAAAGRTFLAIGHIAHHRREWDQMNKLIARNGHNGTVLWERQLPEGYLVHRSAFIATEDTFYMIDGSRALMLDPETGEEQGEVRIPGVDGVWKWMVLDGSVLHVLAGEPDPSAELVKGDRSFGGWSWADLSQGYYTRPNVPWGFGSTLVAYDLGSEEIVWQHDEESPIDSRSMAMGEDRITLYCPHAHLRCLDRESGDVLWTNDEQNVLDLIEEPGQGLTSTPGFRTACLTVFTPDALIIQGQTRQNVVAISTADGYLLWTKKKITNNPNAIYVDGQVILGVGERGSHVALDPVSGEVDEDLGFLKRACTRLTACSDSFFVRGEGTLRYDRESGEVLIDGAARPACNDGALPANGLLYLGPWQCDCNLSLIGRLAKCSAGDFEFGVTATGEERLVRADTETPLEPVANEDGDWPSYRGDNDRSSSTVTEVPAAVGPRWQYRPQQSVISTTPTAVRGLIYSAGEDGVVRAFEASSGRQEWAFPTSAPIKYPPTIADRRAYVGCGDGNVYCLEAVNGRELWRFRAAPTERHIMLYGNMTSTWPVNSGVLVEDGVAYFAAGIIDYDGTHVYGLDAGTGEIVWQNNSSGHLSETLFKGVSVQGNLTRQGDRLLLAGGNQVSPAPFDITTGECLAGPFQQGQPKANNGRFVGLLAGEYPIIGGRVLYSAAENVSTKGSFGIVTGGRPLTLNYGGIPPAWDDDVVALVNFQHGELTCIERDALVEEVATQSGVQPTDRNRWASLADTLSEDAIRWTSDLGESNKFEVVSLVVCPNAIVVAMQQQHRARSQPQWYVAAVNKQTGAAMWRQEIFEEPLPDGLLVDRDGNVVLTMVSGTVGCFGPQ